MFFWPKHVLIFLTSKKHSKTLKQLILKNFTPKNIFHTLQKKKITIDYLSNNSFVFYITYIIFNFLINNNLISDFPNF